MYLHSRLAVWVLFFLLVAFTFGGQVRAAGDDAPAKSAPVSTATITNVVELRLDGEVEPLVAEYIVNGIAQANAQNAGLVLITVNTPGGLDTSMREIIQAILASRVPVVIFVSPTGSRAASAGFFILMSADVAAMSPGTETGAASPIMEIGGSPVKIDDTLARKITNDATAYLRSYTSQRGRNVDLAATAVTDAKAFSADEALKGNLIDAIATSKEDLFAKLEGRTITRFDGAKVQLHFDHPAIGNDRPAKIPDAHRAAGCVFHSADSRRAGAVHGVHAPGRVCAGSDRRHRAGARAVCDAPAAGEPRGFAADRRRIRVIYSGSEISDARRAGCGRRGGDGARRDFPGEVAAYGNGREPVHGGLRCDSFWSDRDFPDAPRAEISKLETRDGQRRIDRRSRRGAGRSARSGAAARVVRFSFRARRVVACGGACGRSDSGRGARACEKSERADARSRAGRATDIVQRLVQRV